jgi:zinc transport system substrate-binding protein
MKAVPENDKVAVVTTLFPYYDFAKQVGGNNAEVTLLLPPGAEAHTYEPKPSDIVRIENADIFIYNGAGLEPWAQDILDGISNKDLVVIDASAHAALAHADGEHADHEDEGDEIAADIEEHEHGEYDPHLWLDFNNDKQIVDAIAAELSKLDSANAQVYVANAGAYKQKLNALQTKYSSGLADCSQDILVSGGHNSLGYLSRTYGFKTVSVFGISPDSEPTPQKVAEITGILKQNGIKYVVFEEMIDPKVARVLASEAGADTAMINPGHNLVKDEFISGIAFIDVMEDNLKTLRIALECR